MDGKKRGGGTAKSKQVKSSEYTVQHSFPPLTLMTGDFICNVDCKLHCMNHAFCTISMSALHGNDGKCLCLLHLEGSIYAWFSCRSI